MSLSLYKDSWLGEYGKDIEEEVMNWLRYGCEYLIAGMSSTKPLFLIVKKLT
jgi:hypothetical protein